MYNELYLAWRKEVDNTLLGGLPRDFYVKLGDYIKHIHEARSLDNKSLKANLLEHEARNVMRMLEELLDARYQKMVKTMTDSQQLPSELLTVEESQLSQNFMAFTGAYKEFTNGLLKGQIEIVEKSVVAHQTETSRSLEQAPIIVKVINEHSRKRAVLRFIKNIPGIIGSDIKTYGPFVAEDIASLPADNAKMLVKQGLAVLVEV